MEIPKQSYLTENKNLSFPTDKYNSANLGFLSKFPDAGLNYLPVNYSNSTFNPEYIIHKNQKEMQVLENTVNSVYIPQEDFDFTRNNDVNVNNNPFRPNFNTYSSNKVNHVIIDSNIYDSNYSFNLKNDNSDANNFNFNNSNYNNSKINNNYNSYNNNNSNNLNNIENIEFYRNNSNNNINNNYDFALQNAENFLNEGTGNYDYAENQAQQSKVKEENLYAKFKSELKQFPELKDLVKESGFNKYAQAFDNYYENDSKGLSVVNNEFNSNLPNNNNKIHHSYNSAAATYSHEAVVDTDIEKSFNYKIEEILEKRNQQIKVNIIESQNNQYSNLLKEIDLLKQKGLQLEDSNFKFKGENE